MTKINPCPICGSEMYVEEDFPWIRLKCSECPLDFGRYWFEEAHVLIKNWNHWTSKEEILREHKRMSHKIAKPSSSKTYDKLFARR